MQSQLYAVRGKPTGPNVVFAKTTIKTKSWFPPLPIKSQDMMDMPCWQPIFLLFNEINALPLAVDPARLDESGGIEVTLRRNGMKYQTNCRLAFNNTKLDRTKKRLSCGGKTDGGHAKQRTSHDGQTCIMCVRTSPESDLGQVMTINLNKRQHECAQTLNDGMLLGNLGGGDGIAQELKYHRAFLTAL